MVAVAVAAVEVAAAAAAVVAAAETTRDDVPELAENQGVAAVASAAAESWEEATDSPAAAAPRVDLVVEETCNLAGREEEPGREDPEGGIRAAASYRSEKAADRAEVRNFGAEAVGRPAVRSKAAAT
jgi:hypothetical protein